MNLVPSVPALPAVKLFALSQISAIHLDISPLTLSVLLMMAGLFVAIVSVILVYHWRRFPFEQEIFARVERIYKLGVIGFLAVAVIGILIA